MLVAHDLKWITACSTIDLHPIRKSIVNHTLISLYLSVFCRSSCLVCDDCLWVCIFLIIISYKHWGLVQHAIISFLSFFSIFFHFPSSIIKQRRQFCSMHARVQSARSLFFLFVTRTGTPTHPRFSLSLSLLFPPFYCRSRAHFLPRG